MKTWVLFSALFFWGTLALGQGIRYQAVARDADGQILASQPLTIAFTVFPAGSTAPWYEEEHTVITDPSGQFALVIGEGSPRRGDWLAVDWAAGPPDLGIRLDAGAGFVDLGRVPLQSVPHSFFAQQAARVDQALGDLTNVDAAAPTDGQVLKYDAASRSWVPANDNVTSGSSGAVNTAPRLLGDGTANNPLDLAAQGAQPGQVLKWNGSAWAPAADAAGTSYNAGAGIVISGNTIVNAGDIDPADDLTQNTNAGGDVAGRFSDLAVVGLRGRPLADIAPNNAQVLAWNSSQDRWQPATINFPSYQAGVGIGLNGNTIFNTGDIDPGDDLTQNTNAGGDVAGRFGNLAVVGLRGRPLLNSNPATGQVLKWNGAAWAPGADLSGASFWTAGNNNSIFFENGFVGVGTSNPLARLHVEGGDVLIRDDFPVLTLNGSGANKIIAFQQGNVEQGGLVYSNAFGLKAYIGNFSPTSTWVLDNDGNFGVGLNNPEEKLHVDGGIRLGNTIRNQAGTLRWTGSDFEGRKGNQWVSLTQQGGSSLWSPSSNDIFYTNGRVGIGTKAPGRLLTVSRASQAAQYQLELRNEGSITNGNFDGIIFTQGATGSTRLASIQVNYHNNGSPDMAFNLRNQSNLVYLEAGGNVGVGTNNPGARLDVNGDIRTNGEVRRTATGSANMVPIAYGNVGSDGKLNTGTGNFSVSRKSTGRYEIALNGETFFFEDYIVQVSLAGEPGFITYSSVNGKLLVRTSNLVGIVLDADRSFSFVVYKP